MRGSLRRLMLARTWGSNGPVERTGGEARRQVYQALQGETPFGARESTRTTRNGVDFHNTEDIGWLRQFGLSDSSNKDAVAVGRDEAKGPDSRIVLEVYRRFPSRRKLAKVGGDSRAVSIDQ